MKTKFMTNGKHKIAYFENKVEGADLGVIIVHGLAEHKGRYENFINQLGENSISAFAMDLRGHGESSGRRACAKSYKQLLGDLDFFVRNIKEQNPNLKLFLFGHSMGGQLSFVYSAVYGGLDGLIMSNPPLAYPPQMSKFLPYRLFGFIRIGKKPSQTQKIFDAGTDDPLACKSFTLRIVGVIFKEGLKIADKSFANIKCPLLMLAGKEDALVACSSTIKAFEKIESENKSLKIYDGVKHRIVQTEGAEERINDIIEWITQQ